MSTETTILIGYDDHTSTYSVSRDLLERLLDTEDANEANDMITHYGTYVGCEYEGELFLDLINHDSESLHSQIEEYLEENPK